MRERERESKKKKSVQGVVKLRWFSSFKKKKKSTPWRKKSIDDDFKRMATAKKKEQNAPSLGDCMSGRRALGLCVIKGRRGREEEIYERRILFFLYGVSFVVCFLRISNESRLTAKC